MNKLHEIWVNIQREESVAIGRNKIINVPILVTIGPVVLEYFYFLFECQILALKVQSTNPFS